MQPATGRRLLTFEDFLEMVREDQKADLIDGVIHMASPESLEGNNLVAWLSRVLGLFVEERDLGQVFVSRVAFRLAGHHGPEPDVAFVRQDRMHLARYGYFDGPPDLAVEVVSPESVERDYEKKRQAYQEAGVPEYWIIDEELGKVTTLRLEGGTYADVPLTDGKIRSTVVPGFWLRPEWLLKLPRPRTLSVVTQLLTPEAPTP